MISFRKNKSIPSSDAINATKMAKITHITKKDMSMIDHDKKKKIASFHTDLGNKESFPSSSSASSNFGKRYNATSIFDSNDDIAFLAKSNKRIKLNQEINKSNYIDNSDNKEQSLDNDQNKRTKLNKETMNVLKCAYSMLNPLERLLNIVHIPEHRNIALSSIISLTHTHPELLHNKSSILLKFLSVSINGNNNTILTVAELMINANKSLACMQSHHNGNSPMHIALLYHGQNINLIKLLASYDTMQVTNKKHELPIHIAINSIHNVSWDVLQFIVSSSCQKSNACLQRDINGNTPISLAWNQLTNHTKININDNEDDYNTVIQSPYWSIILLLLKSISSNPFMSLLHLASIASHFNIMQIALFLHPYQIYYPDAYTGRLPLHYCVSNYNDTLSWMSSFDILLGAYPKATSFMDHDDRLPLHVALDSECSLHAIQRILQIFPQAIFKKDPITFLYPFMLAATTSSVDVIFYLLSFSPELVPLSI